MSEELYKKWYDILNEIESAHADHIGGIGIRWLGRLIRGVAPIDEKAPWWLRLKEGPLFDTIKEFIDALERDKKTTDKIISSLVDMISDFNKSGSGEIR